MTGASRTATNFACQLADGHDRRQMARTGCARNASRSARQTRKTGSRQYDWGSKNPQSTPLPSFPDLTRAAARQGPVFRRCDLNSQSRPHCCRSSAPRIAVPMTGSKALRTWPIAAAGRRRSLERLPPKAVRMSAPRDVNSRTRPVSDTALNRPPRSSRRRGVSRTARRHARGRDTWQCRRAFMRALPRSGRAGRDRRGHVSLDSELMIVRAGLANPACCSRLAWWAAVAAEAAASPRRRRQHRR